MSPSMNATRDMRECALTVQPRARSVAHMQARDPIVLARYHDLEKSLRVEFKSGRITVFHAVPITFSIALADPATRDEVLQRDIIGHFTWTECGVLPSAHKRGRSASHKSA